MAAGLTLASDVYAKYNIPASELSSMDGYANRFEDKDSVLTISGEMRAGAQVKLSISTQQAVCIFTGTQLPAGADTVVMQKKVKLENNKLSILDDQLQLGNNVKNTGAVVKSNALAMAKGTFVGGMMAVDNMLYKKILGILLLIPALRFFFLKNTDPKDLKNAGFTWSLLIGAASGLLSGMIGIGGGIILSPFIT